MHRIFAVILCAIGLLIGPDAIGGGGEAKDEMKKLEGTWVVQTANFSGKELPAAKGGAGSKMEFKGERIHTSAFGGQEQDLIYRIDPSKNPKTMNFAHLGEKARANEPGEIGQAIYELKGDSLTICIGPPDRRPTAFGQKGTATIVLKRQ